MNDTILHLLSGIGALVVAAAFLWLIATVLDWIQYFAIGWRQAKSNAPAVLAWEQVDKLRGERDVLLARNEIAVSALDHIGIQPCQCAAEGSGEDVPCCETGTCATEWCLPCYAAVALRTLPAVMP